MGEYVPTVGTGRYLSKVTSRLGKVKDGKKSVLISLSPQWPYIKEKLELIIVRTLREGQPLRLLLNLLFYHFNHSEPTYKFKRTKLLDVTAVCNQLKVNALN